MMWWFDNVMFRELTAGELVLNLYEPSKCPIAMASTKPSFRTIGPSSEFPTRGGQTVDHCKPAVAPAKGRIDGRCRWYEASNKTTDRVGIGMTGNCRHIATANSYQYQWDVQNQDHCEDEGGLRSSKETHQAGAAAHLLVLDDFTMRQAVLSTRSLLATVELPHDAVVAVKIMKLLLSITSVQ
jgi:hypothetical protein